MNDISIGLLGCGFISQFAHVAALRKAEGVKFTAVCDVAEDLAREVASRNGVPQWYSDPDRFLAESGVDAVLVATSDQYHVSNAIECLRQGKHVLVEKPLGANLDECRGLAAVVEETGRKLQVGFMKRYDPGVQFAHRFLSEHLGARLSLSGWYCDTAVRPLMQASFFEPMLRSRQQRGFDPAFKKDRKLYKLMTHGSHLVDMMRNLGGPITAVEASFCQRNQDLSWHGLLEFSDGAVGNFELTTAVQRDWLEGFRVHGERGSIEIESYWPFERRASRVRAFDAERAEYRSPISPDSDPYERQVEAFARAIREDLPVTPNVSDGLANMQVLAAIRQSVETRQWVQVPGR